MLNNELRLSVTEGNKSIFINSQDLYSYSFVMQDRLIKICWIQKRKKEIQKRKQQKEQTRKKMGRKKGGGNDEGGW